MGVSSGGGLVGVERERRMEVHEARLCVAGILGRKAVRVLVLWTVRDGMPCVKFIKVIVQSAVMVVVIVMELLGLGWWKVVGPVTVMVSVDCGSEGFGLISMGVRGILDLPLGVGTQPGGGVDEILGCE